MRRGKHTGLCLGCVVVPLCDQKERFDTIDRELLRRELTQNSLRFSKQAVRVRSSIGKAVAQLRAPISLRPCRQLDLNGTGFARKDGK